MGNEGSIPTDDGSDGFEYQARSPPSAILPPGSIPVNQSNLNGTSQHSQQTGRDESYRGVPRLKGTVFGRRAAQNQNSTGIERAPGAYGMNSSSDHSSSSYQTATAGNYGDELAYMTPGRQAPQHQYHQQPSYPGPVQQQHPQHYQQQQHVYAQQPYPQSQQPYLQQQHQQQQYPPQQQPPQHYSQPQPHQQKKSRPGQRAGAAIINSMRNLNISSAMHRIGGKSPSGSPSRAGGRRQPPFSSNKKHPQQTVNEWETRWDEDSDEEDEENHIKLPQQQPQHPGGAVPTTVLPQQPMRPPELDSGYANAAAASPAKPLASELQQQQTYSPGTPGARTDKTSPGTPQTVVTDDEHDADDGVEWDTGAPGNAAVGPASNDEDTSTPNVQQFLPLLRVLGKGSFGKVVLVQKRVGREQGSLFAMKILKKSHLVRRRQIERTRTERKVLSAVNHPFIMKLHYAFQSPDKLYLVLDYCPGGELFFHLSRFRRFPERVARFYAAELLLALGHLHKRGIIYRDLKPENVLLDADGHVKLGDFGLAKAGIRHAYEGATSMCGTPEYMAPEVLAQQGHGFCVDYWGLGMLTYEMMTGLPPWYTTDRAKLFRRLRNAPLDIPPYFSTSSASFSSALLERNPRRRLGVTGIRAAMEHEFFKSISWRALYGRKVEAPIRPCEGWSPPGNEEQQQQQNAAPSNSGSNPIPTDLDAATANFDNQFTRMPVDSVNENGDDDDDLEELHEDTFVGFTFDDNDRDAIEAAQQLKQQQMRQRTQHYNSSGGAGEGHQID